MSQLGHSSWQYLHPNQCLHVSTWPPFMTKLASFWNFRAVKKIYLKFPEIGQRRDQIVTYTKGSKDKSNDHHSSFESVSFFPVSADHEAHSQYILRREQEQKGFRGRNCCILLQLPRLVVFKQIKRFYSNYGIQFKWGRLQDFKCQLDWRQRLRTTKVVTRTSVSPSSHSHVPCNLSQGGVSVTLCHIGSSTGKNHGGVWASWGKHGYKLSASCPGNPKAFTAICPLRPPWSHCYHCPRF